MENPLLHQSGEKSSMSLIGTMPKVNDSPSPTMQDGTVIGTHPTVPSAESPSVQRAVDHPTGTEDDRGANDEQADLQEPPTEFLKAVGDAKAQKLNPWD